MNVAANPDSMGKNCTRPARARHVPKVIRCTRTSTSTSWPPRCFTRPVSN